jgi:hypothetical protein
MAELGRDKHLQARGHHEAQHDPEHQYELLLYNPSQTTNVVVNIYNKEAALGSGSRDCLLYGPITISKNVPTAVGAFKTYKAAGAGSYVTDTTHINEASANDVELVPVATVEDAAYFGAYLPFNAIKVDIGTAGNYVATTVWEYWNGSAWTALTVTDGTVSGGLTFAQDGVVSFSEPSDWATVAVDSTTMYWVRCRVSAFTSVATAPLCTQAWLMGAKTTTAQVFSSTGYSVAASTPGSWHTTTRCSERRTLSR